MLKPELKSLKLIAITLSINFFISLSVAAIEQHVENVDVVINTPAGFSLSSRFNGFEQLETFATIKIEETIEPLVSALERHLKNNDSGSNTVLFNEPTNISDRTGSLIKSQLKISNSQFEQWILLFGDNISTIAITASYPITLSDSMGPLLKQSLLSSRWLRKPAEQLFRGLPFKVKQSNDLHFAKRTLNSLVLKSNGPYDRSKTVIPLSILSSVKNEQGVVDIVAFSNQQLNNNQGVSNINITTAQEIKVAGIRAYQIIADAIDDKSASPIIIYQTIAFQPKRYLLILGISARSQAQQFLPQFKQVTDSVSFHKG